MQPFLFARLRNSTTFTLGAVMLTLSGCGGSGSPVAPVGSNAVVGNALPAATAAPAVTAAPTLPPTSQAFSCTTTPLVSAAIKAASGGSEILNPSGGGVYTLGLAPGVLTSDTTVQFAEISQANLPAPLNSISVANTTGSLLGRRYGAVARSSQATVQGTYVYGLCANVGAAGLNGAVTIAGVGTVPASIPVGTVLNVAAYSATANGYVTVGTASVGSGGSLQTLLPTATLPGINQSGQYVVYQPPLAQTAIANYGFVIMADDGTDSTGNGGLQLIHVEDTQGNAVPTPASTTIPIPGSDLDGLSLTPDGSRGIVVDGGNLVYSFSGANTNSVAVNSKTIDVTNYGGDGDSVVAIPGGDEAIVTANGNDLVNVTGILSGNPVIAQTIHTTAAGGIGDGLAIANNGATLLARSQSDLFVYQIKAIPPAPGPLAGTISHSFTQVADLQPAANPAAPTAQLISTPDGEDGRDGMAFSPADSSRAVIVGHDANLKPTIQLLTGLPTSPALQSTSMRIPAVQSHRIISSRERSRRPQSAAIAGGTQAYAVSISQDGKYAVVATDAGIVVFSGVDTGNLTQVTQTITTTGGQAYNPALSVPGAGTTPTSCTFAPLTLAITADNKYVAAVTNCNLATAGNGPGVLLTIPLNAGGVLGAPVGQLNNTFTPNNDQLVAH